MFKRPGDKHLAPQRPNKRLSQSSSPAPGSVERNDSEAVSTSAQHHVVPLASSTAVRENENPPTGPNSAADAGPKCFRITNVPTNWDMDALLGALHNIDPSLKDRKFQLSLFPGCYDLTQTALLNLSTCTEYFQSLKSNESNYKQALDETLLVIDDHFYEMTPLNVPEGEIVAEYYPISNPPHLQLSISSCFPLPPNLPDADFKRLVCSVVAVTGLAGHAFGSWRSRKTRDMWLKDYLPEDIKHIRIMTYGYNSSLVEGNDVRLSDHRRHFIQQLENCRISAEVSTI